MEDVSTASGLELEIEVPDARPSHNNRGGRHKALASLGLGQNIGLGYIASPSNGPISLASAANSVEGSPNPHTFTPNKSRARHHEDEGVIDFGDIGGGASDEEEEDAEGEDEDVDVEPMSIGSPAQGRRVSVAGGMVDEEEGEEDDPLFKEMMEGLAGGESSEESEEE